MRPAVLTALFAAPLLSTLVVHGGCDTPQRTVKVTLLAFNDFHGQLEAPTGSGGQVLLELQPDGGRVVAEAGGAAHFSAKVKQLREANPNTVVVAAGDLIGGTPLLSALFHDEPTIEAMNEIGLDLIAVGNHEFDDGREELLRMQSGGCHPKDGCQDGTPFEGARFQYLAANVVADPASGETLFPRYAVRSFEGAKIAFIGMTLEGTPLVVSPQGIAGLEFKDEVETVNGLVPELKKQGIHAIVVLVHEGGAQTGLYDQCEGVSGEIVRIAEQLDPAVDAIVSGHTHQAYNCVIAGKRVTSALSTGRVLTKLELELDRATGEAVSVTAENQVVTRDAGSDQAVSDLVARYNALTTPLRDRVVGHLTATLVGPRNPQGQTPAGETTLGNVVADAMLAATRAQENGGAQLALMNPGGIRADLSAGTLTYGQIFTVQPFGNTLMVLTYTGAQLEAILEQQWAPVGPRVLQVAGLRYAWNPGAPAGDRVDPASITVGGAPISLTAKYRVVTNAFLAFGGDSFSAFTEGTERTGGPVDLDAFEAYLKINDPLSPPALGRINLASPAGN
jgi:5'-nucleotidase